MSATLEQRVVARRAAYTVTHWACDADPWRDEAHALDQQNVKLRAALTELLDACDGNDHEPFCKPYHNNYWHRAQETCRALLQEETDAT